MSKHESTRLISNDSDSDLRQWLVAAREGSDSGFGRLLESFRPGLLLLAKQRLGPDLQRRISSSDIVQDTMLTARKQFASFQGNYPSEFREWLLQMFQSRLVDGMRHHLVAEKRRIDREEATNLSQLEDSTATPSEVFRQNEDATRLMNAFDELSPELRELMRMRYIENQSFEEIASHLEISVATAWRRFQAAATAIHKSMRESGG